MRQQVVQFPFQFVAIYLWLAIRFLQRTINKAIFGIGNDRFRSFAIFFFELRNGFFGSGFYF